MEKYILVKKDDIQPFLESRDFYKCCYNNEEKVYFVPEYLYEEVMLFNPKKGDFCVDKEGIIFIVGYVDKFAVSDMCFLDNNVANVDSGMFIFNKSECRYATKKEKQKLLNALKKAHYQYDKESKSIIPIKWRAKYGKRYFYIDTDFDICDSIDTYSGEDLLFEVNNYFRTREDAEFVAQKLKEQLSELNKFHQ